MTPQEAIKILEPYKSCTFGDASHGGEVTVIDIIELLKKQVPQKLEKKVDMFDTSYNLYCPACGTYFGTRGKRGIWLGKKPAYCDCCGQRLDWSDVDANIPK